MIENDDPALAFAVYAATAASFIANALRRHDLLTDEEIKTLVSNLTAARTKAGDNPYLIEVAELLTDTLLDASKSDR